MNMKSIFLAVCAFLSAGAASAQISPDDIGFAARVAENTALNDAGADNLTRKINQALAACNAGNVEVTNAFVIEADVVPGKTIVSASTLQPVTVQTGTLVLIAKERVTGSIYNSAEVELESAEVGASAVGALLQSIRPKDPSIVRFIRNSRSRIAKFYEENGLPLPYYRKRGDKEEPVQPEPAPVPEPVAPAPEPVVPEPVAPAPEPVAPVPEPVAPTPEPVQPEGPTLDYDRDLWDIQLVSCRGVRSTNTVKIEVRITNKQQKRNEYNSIVHAYTPSGADANQWSNVEEKGYSSYTWCDFPQGVPVGRVFKCTKVDNTTEQFMLVEMQISSSTTVAIRNLPIQWQ